MSSRRSRLRLPLVGAALAVVGSGLGLAPARAERPILVEALLGRYIVTLDDSVADPAAVGRRQVGPLGGSLDRVFTTALKGYSAALPQAVLSGLLADPRVRSIEPDVEVGVSAVQPIPSYGLDRVDQRDLPLSRSFGYTTTGQGVRAYVVDTGTRADHPDFRGRVAPGRNALDGSSNAFDCSGHGTHVAGILGSSTYGVAKDVTIVPVKIFGCSGRSPLSVILGGIDWVAADHRPGQPAVANLSFSGTASPALDRAVTALSDDDVAVTVAAGNDASNACSASPSRVPQVLTVASTDASDTVARTSNRGPCVDLFAPGVGITSTDLRTNGSRVSSGTSMAAPFVAGALARELQKGATAQQAQQRVVAAATTNRVRGADRRPASPNRLLYAG